MSKLKMLRVLGAVAACYAVLFAGGAADAENRWIDETLSTELGVIMRDDVRDRVYLADNANTELVIIDTVEEKVIDRLPLPDKISDMDISKNRKWLVVATGGGVTKIDLNNLQIKELQISKEVEGVIRSVAFDCNGFIYAATSINGRQGWIYALIPNGKKVVNRFGVRQNLARQVYGGLLKTDPTGTILYVGEQGLSPASLYKIDISHRKRPVFLAEDDHGGIGSNLRDFVISNRYNEVYLACGAPYGIQVVDSQTMHFIDVLFLGAYPCAVDLNLSGDRVYGASWNPYSSHLDKFDATPETRGLIETYEFLSKVNYGTAQYRGLAVDRFGEKAFVVHGWIYSADKQMKVQVIDLAE